MSLWESFQEQTEYVQKFARAFDPLLDGTDLFKVLGSGEDFKLEVLLNTHKQSLEKHLSVQPG